jgi:hypothetical protein
MLYSGVCGDSSISNPWLVPLRGGHHAAEPFIGYAALIRLVVQFIVPLVHSVGSKLRTIDGQVPRPYTRLLPGHALHRVYVRSTHTGGHIRQSGHHILSRNLQWRPIHSAAWRRCPFSVHNSVFASAASSLHPWCCSGASCHLLHHMADAAIDDNCTTFPPSTRKPAASSRNWPAACLA